MGHGLRFDTVNGVSFVRAAYNGEEAWHKLGTVGKFSNMFEMRDAAHMNYTAELAQAECAGVPVPGQYFIRRDDDGAVVSSTTVSANYEVLPVGELFEILELLREQGYVEPATAMVIADGSVEIVTAKFVTPTPVLDAAGSPVNFYLNAHNLHGDGCAFANAGGIREVCKNTFQASVQQYGKAFKVRHSVGVADRFKLAMNAMEAVQERVALWAEHYAKLNIPCSIPETVEKVLGLDGIEPDKWTKQAENKRNELIQRANDARNGAHGKTLQDVFNAVTNWNTFYTGGKDGTDDGTRAQSMILGSRAKFEAQAWSTLQAIAAS